MMEGLPHRVGVMIITLHVTSSGFGLCGSSPSTSFTVESSASCRVAGGSLTSVSLIGHEERGGRYAAR